jgi:hypothetical protein
MGVHVAPEGGSRLDADHAVDLSHIHPINVHHTNRGGAKAKLIRPVQGPRGASRHGQTGTGTLS